MNRATPEMRHFARRLIVHEAKEKKSSAPGAPTAFDVLEKLRPQLMTLMGNGGYRALLSRSLALASVEIPWLRPVWVKMDGTFEGAEEQRVRLTPAEFLEGRVVLLAQLLGLLVAFIGEKLTLRMVLEVWPEIPLSDLSF